MKKIVLAMFVCLFSASLSAQEVPKKANYIVISDSLSQAENFSLVTDLLFEHGYGVLNSDRESGIISTTEKDFKNGSIKLNIQAKDGKLSFRGDYISNISFSLNGVTASSSWTNISNIGQRNSVTQNAWNEMQKIINALPGEKEYLIR